MTSGHLGCDEIGLHELVSRHIYFRPDFLRIHCLYLILGEIYQYFCYDNHHNLCHDCCDSWMHNGFLRHHFPLLKSPLLPRASFFFLALAERDCRYLQLSNLYCFLPTRNDIPAKHFLVAAVVRASGSPCSRALAPQLIQDCMLEAVARHSDYVGDGFYCSERGCGWLERSPKLPYREQRTGRYRCTCLIVARICNILLTLNQCISVTGKVLRLRRRICALGVPLKLRMEKWMYSYVQR